MVVVIMAREFIVSAVRGYSESQGMKFPATLGGQDQDVHPVGGDLRDPVPTGEHAANWLGGVGEDFARLAGDARDGSERAGVRRQGKEAAAIQ